jgi:hypothetical protein
MEQGQRWKQLDKDQWFGLLLSNNLTELPSKNPTKNEKPRKESQAINHTQSHLREYTRNSLQ